MPARDPERRQRGAKAATKILRGRQVACLLSGQMQSVGKSSHQQRQNADIDGSRYPDERNGTKLRKRQPQFTRPRP